MTQTSSSGETTEIARPSPRDEFWDQIDRVFRDLHAHLPNAWGFPAAVGLSIEGSAPAPADVVDLGESFELRVDLPGVPKEKVDLRVTGETVHVTAPTEPAPSEEGRTYLRRERSETGFHREIELPEPVRSDEVKARFENGVLTISVPKAHPVKERRVPLD